MLISWTIIVQCDFLANRTPAAGVGAGGRRALAPGGVAWRRTAGHAGTRRESRAGRLLPVAMPSGGCMQMQANMMRTRRFLRRPGPAGPGKGTNQMGSPSILQRFLVVLVPNNIAAEHASGCRFEHEDRASSMDLHLQYYMSII